MLFRSYQNYLFNLNNQYQTEDNLNAEEVDLHDNLTSYDYFDQNYAEFNSQNSSLNNSSINTSTPYINPTFDDVSENGDSFLNTTINYADYDSEDDYSPIADNEIHYLNFIRKSEIAVSQNNSSASYQYSNYQQAENVKTYSIVCIDDSKTVVNAIKMYLDDKIFSVIGINDPLKALMQIVRLKPDLILLDIGMPTLDGYELCSLLRKHSSLKETPVIMEIGRASCRERV